MQFEVGRLPKLGYSSMKCLPARTQNPIDIVFLVLILQPFIAMGDLTFGNFFMASGTALLPVFTLVSIYKYWRIGLFNWAYKADFVSLILLLQLLIVLTFNDLIPFVLWK